MSPTFDPDNLVLPSEQRSRAIQSTLMFSRRTIWMVYLGVNALAVGLILWSLFDRSALLTPIGPSFRASMIGLGVFLGVLTASVEREAWLLGFGGYRAPKGIFVPIAMAALVAASGFGGDYVARKLWEWQAFHGLHPTGVDRGFTIIGRSSGRNGDSLELRDSATDRSFSISCSSQTYATTQIGDRLILPVETGRGGAQRVTLPAARDLRQE